jgi:hypothetical protein
MKKSNKNIIEVQKDTKLPGTKIILEKGDKIEIVTEKFKGYEVSTKSKMVRDYIVNLYDEYQDVYSVGYQTVVDALETFSNVSNAQEFLDGLKAGIQDYS